MNGFFLLHSLSLLFSMSFSCCDKIIMSNETQTRLSWDFLFPRNHKRDCNVEWREGDMIHMPYRTLHTLYGSIFKSNRFKSTQNTNSLGNHNKMRFPLIIIIQMYFVNKQANKICWIHWRCFSEQKKSVNWEIPKKRLSNMDCIKFGLITLESITCFS